MSSFWTPPSIGVGSDVAPSSRVHQTSPMPTSLKVLVGALALALVASPAVAQEAPAPGGPKVGEMAPDFELPAATKTGPSQTPIRLSDLRGQTVVIAFFPKARTGG